MSGVVSVVCGWPIRVVSRRFGKGRVSVFLLHRVAGMNPGIGGHRIEEVGSMLDGMRRSGARFVSVADVVDAAAGRRDVVGDEIAFSVDDGYADQADLLVPAFLERNVPLTLFVITGLIDGTTWPWDAKINWLVRQTTVRTIDLRLGTGVLRYAVDSSSAKRASGIELVEAASGIRSSRLQHMLVSLQEAAEVEIPERPPVEYAATTWERLRKLEKEGLTVAPHTVTHRIVSRLSSHEVEWEVKESLARVREELASPLPVLAWPLGRFRHVSSRDMVIAERAGISVSFSANGGYSNVERARVDVYARHSLARLHWENSTAHMLRVSTGLEAIRESMSKGTPARRIPKWVMNAAEREAIPASVRARRAIRSLVVETKARFQARKLDFLRPGRIPGRSLERLVFVCLGNICRSPFAAEVARQYGVTAESIGIDVGTMRPADEVAVKVSLMLGKDISDHVARPTESLAVRDTDCLVAMEPEHLVALAPLISQKGCQSTLLGAWASSPLARIRDPYGKGPREMEEVFAIIEDAVFNLLDELGLGEVQDRLGDPVVAEPARKRLSVPGVPKNRDTGRQT